MIFNSKLYKESTSAFRKRLNEKLETICGECPTFSENSINYWFFKVSKTLGLVIGFDEETGLIVHMCFRNSEKYEVDGNVFEVTYMTDDETLPIATHAEINRAVDIYDKVLQSFDLMGLLINESVYEKGVII